MSRLLPARARALACALAALVALPGCTPLLAVDERALVLALAIDRGPCPGGVTATAQWYSSAPSLMIGGKLRAETKSACARTLNAAITALRGHSHRYLAFGATNLILLGAGEASDGVGGSLDFAWRDGSLPAAAQVAVVDGRAGDLLARPEDEAAFPLSTRLTDAVRSNLASTPTPLWRFVARRYGLPGDAWAPMLAPTAGGVRDAGVAAFAAGHMVAHLTGPAATAFGWLTKLGGYGDLEVTKGRSAAATPIALRVVDRSLGRSCRDGAPVITLALQTRVRQGEGVRLRGRDATGLEAMAARAAWRDTALALRDLIDSGTDPVGLRTFGCRPGALTAPATRVGLRVTVTVRPDEREA